MKKKQEEITDTGSSYYKWIPSWIAVRKHTGRFLQTLYSDKACLRETLICIQRRYGGSLPADVSASLDRFIRDTKPGSRLSHAEARNLKTDIQDFLACWHLDCYREIERFQYPTADSVDRFIDQCKARLPPLLYFELLDFRNKISPEPQIEMEKIYICDVKRYRQRYIKAISLAIASLLAWLMLILVIIEHI